MSAGLYFRLVAFVCAGAAAVALGFFLVPPFAALGFVQHAGYFVILTGLVGFIVAWIRLSRRDGVAWPWSRPNRALALAALVVAVFWQLHGPHGFKVLMDEQVIGATAMSMHFDREVFVILKAHDINGVYSTLGGVVDKRPVFFPLLLSFVHDLAGYRPGNVFALNALLSWLFVYLAGCLGRRIGRNDNAGLLTIGLLAGLPLLATNATGGGFEILNLVMITGAILLAIRWLGQPDDLTLDAFILGVVLLAQTRYESAIFVGVAGLIVLWGWVRARRVVISWGTVVAPLLLILVPLQNKVFEVNKGYWQLEESAGGPFQLQYLPGNLGHAVQFLFTVDGFQLSSPLLSIAGLFCTVMLLVHGAKRWRQLGGEPETGVLLLFGAAVLTNFLLLLCYHWGQLDDFVATRLGLPLLLVFALSTTFVAGRGIRSRPAWVVSFSVLGAWALCGAVPIAARAEATITFLSYREVSWQQEFVLAHQGLRNLFILPSPLPAVLQREPAMSVAVFAERAEEMDFHLREKTYRDVYIFQRFEADPVTREPVPAKHSALGPEFILETIEERRFRPLYTMRVSRLIGIDLSRRAPRPPDWKPGFPPFELKDTSDDNSPGAVYIREYLQKLP